MAGINCDGCRDCTERHIGCHGECSRYKEWKEEYQKQKEEADKLRKKSFIGYYHK